MRPDYRQWLIERTTLSTSGQANYIAYAKRVEQSYGDLDAHFANGTYQSIIDSMQYSAKDKRENKPNPSKIDFSGDTYNNLQSYKSATVRYLDFLQDSGFKDTSSALTLRNDDTSTVSEDSQQRLTLERDMQEALRRNDNIARLNASLKIIDNGFERKVTSGFIDITCEDGDAMVAIELKVGKADSRAIGQILGYMGDLQEEEPGKPVRGILVAHDFDCRAKAAARVVPTLTLMKYSIEFKFTAEN